MPSKRRTGDLAVPDLSDDPAERKRVLNILAQRRYREKKRVRLQTLEKQVESQSLTTGPAATSNATSESCFLGTVGNTSTQSGSNNATSRSNRGPVSESSCSSSNGSSSDPIMSLATPDISSPGFLSLMSASSPSQSFFPLLPVPADDPFSFPLGTGSGHVEYDQTLDSWLNEPESEENTNSTISDQLQMYQAETFTFPDDHIIEIPSLTLLNAAVKIALRLNIGSSLWDMAAVSPFYTGPSRTGSANLVLSSAAAAASSFASASSSSSSASPPSVTFSSSSPSGPGRDSHNTLPIDIPSLPAHLQPTPSQRLIPHHPMLDILPWPNARDRLIQVFSLPIELRPKEAQDPLALFRFAYDMEDVGGEGIKIHGPDPFEPDVWEIGQLVFERWWWAFEINIVEKSNRARKERGERGLTCQAPSIS